MEFASAIFIWLFLPLSLLLYYALNLIRAEEKRLNAQNMVLLLLSCLFYLWGGFKAFALLCGLTVFNYAAGLIIEKRREKWLLALTVAADCSALAFFKYMNLRGMVMPLALSFIIFQAVSYLADVFKGRVKAERSFLQFALYIGFFAQMVQGPIMRFEVLGSQIKKREHSFELFAAGVKRFCIGLGKKIIIANSVGTVSDLIWSTDPSSLFTSQAWLGIVLYTLQIYFDFSGYSDMAVGVGKMFGFTLSENFDYPYTSLSVQEFWRRWHISLSGWFRDYIYIPLGGNRKGRFRTELNLFIVFLITGIWHGADLSFICWGVFFGILSISEREFLGKWLKKNPVKPLNWLYTSFAVMMSWVMFRAKDMSYALSYYKVLFTGVTAPEGLSLAMFLSWDVLFAMLLGIVLSGWPQRWLRPVYEKAEENTGFKAAEALFLFAVFAWSLLLIVAGSYSPSIYGAF